MKWTANARAVRNVAVCAINEAFKLGLNPHDTYSLNEKSTDTSALFWFPLPDGTRLHCKLVLYYTNVINVEIYDGEPPTARRFVFFKFTRGPRVRDRCILVRPRFTQEFQVTERQWMLTAPKHLTQYWGSFIVEPVNGLYLDHIPKDDEL